MISLNDIWYEIATVCKFYSLFVRLFFTPLSLSVFSSVLVRSLKHTIHPNFIISAYVRYCYQHSNCLQPLNATDNFSTTSTFPNAIVRVFFRSSLFHEQIAVNDGRNKKDKHRMAMAMGWIPNLAISYHSLRFHRKKTLFSKWYLRTQIDLYSLRTGTFVVALIWPGEESKKRESVGRELSVASDHEAYTQQRRKSNQNIANSYKCFACVTQHKHTLSWLWV